MTTKSGSSGQSTSKNGAAEDQVFPAMYAASQLPGRGPTDVDDDAPASVR